MAKVSAKISLTLKLFKDSQYEFIRPSIEISEIDADKDLQPQIENAIKALEKTWDTIVDEMNKKIVAEMPKVNAEMELQINRRLAEFGKELDSIKKTLRKKV